MAGYDLSKNLGTPKPKSSAKTIQTIANVLTKGSTNPGGASVKKKSFAETLPEDGKQLINPINKSNQTLATSLSDVKNILIQISNFFTNSKTEQLKKDQVLNKFIQDSTKSLNSIQQSLTILANADPSSKFNDDAFIQKFIQQFNSEVFSNIESSITNINESMTTLSESDSGITQLSLNTSLTLVKDVLNVIVQNTETQYDYRLDFLTVSQNLLTLNNSIKSIDITQLQNNINSLSNNFLANTESLNTLNQSFQENNNSSNLLPLLENIDGNITKYLTTDSNTTETNTNTQESSSILEALKTFQVLVNTTNSSILLKIESFKSEITTNNNSILLKINSIDLSTILKSSEDTIDTKTTTIISSNTIADSSQTNEEETNIISLINEKLSIIVELKLEYKSFINPTNIQKLYTNVDKFYLDKTKESETNSIPQNSTPLVVKPEPQNPIIDTTKKIDLEVEQIPPSKPPVLVEVITDDINKKINPELNAPKKLEGEPVLENELEIDESFLYSLEDSFTELYIQQLELLYGFLDLVDYVLNNELFSNLYQYKDTFLQQLLYQNEQDQIQNETPWWEKEQPTTTEDQENSHISTEGENTAGKSQQENSFEIPEGNFKLKLKPSGKFQWVKDLAKSDNFIHDAGYMAGQALGNLLFKRKKKKKELETPKPVDLGGESENTEEPPTKLRNVLSGKERSNVSKETEQPLTMPETSKVQNTSGGFGKSLWNKLFGNTTKKATSGAGTFVRVSTVDLVKRVEYVNTVGMLNGNYQIQRFIANPALMQQLFNSVSMMTNKGKNNFPFNPFGGGQFWRAPNNLRKYNFNKSPFGNTPDYYNSFGNDEYSGYDSSLSKGTNTKTNNKKSGEKSGGFEIPSGNFKLEESTSGRLSGLKLLAGSNNFIHDAGYMAGQALGNLLFKRKKKKKELETPKPVDLGGNDKQPEEQIGNKPFGRFGGKLRGRLGGAVFGRIGGLMSQGFGNAGRRAITGAGTLVRVSTVDFVKRVGMVGGQPKTNKSANILQNMSGKLSDMIGQNDSSRRLLGRINKSNLKSLRSKEGKMLKQFLPGGKGGKNPISSVKNAIKTAKNVANMVKTGANVAKAANTAAAAGSAGGVAAALPAIAAGALVAGVAATGAWGAAHREEYAKEVGGKKAGTSDTMDAIDAGLGKINHVFGMGNLDRLASFAKTGDIGRLWGIGNKYGDDYTAAEWYQYNNASGEEVMAGKRRRQHAMMEKEYLLKTKSGQKLAAIEQMKGKFKKENDDLMKKAAERMKREGTTASNGDTMSAPKDVLDMDRNFASGMTKQESGKALAAVRTRKDLANQSMKVSQAALAGNAKDFQGEKGKWIHGTYSLIEKTAPGSTFDLYGLLKRYNTQKNPDGTHKMPLPELKRRLEEMRTAMDGDKGIRNLKPYVNRYHISAGSNSFLGGTESDTIEGMKEYLQGMIKNTDNLIKGKELVLKAEQAEATIQTSQQINDLVQQKKKAAAAAGGKPPGIEKGNAAAKKSGASDIVAKAATATTKKAVVDKTVQQSSQTITREGNTTNIIHNETNTSTQRPAKVTTVVTGQQGTTPPQMNINQN